MENINDEYIKMYDEEYIKIDNEEYIRFKIFNELMNNSINILKENQKLREEIKKLKDEKEKTCEKFIKCMKCNSLHCQECEADDILEILPLDENKDATINFICNDCIICEYSQELEKEDYKIKEDDIYLCQECEKAQYSQKINYSLIDCEEKISGKKPILKCNDCLKK